MLLENCGKDGRGLLGLLAVAEGVESGLYLLKLGLKFSLSISSSIYWAFGLATLRLMTLAEHQELIRYEDLVEQYRVDRLQALIELAKLRNLDLVSLNQQMSSPRIYSMPSEYARVPQ